MNNTICSECNALLIQHNCVVYKIKSVYPECYDKRGNDDMSKIACKDCDEKSNMINYVVNGLTQLSYRTTLIDRLWTGSQSRS